MNQSSATPAIHLTVKDALVVVDVQKDFLERGSLPVPDSSQIIAVLNSYLELFERYDLPVFATRDWHPLKHCSFQEQGGPWPEHCVQYTEGAAFADGLYLPDNMTVISKGTGIDTDAYSGFQGTGLEQQMRELNIERLFVGGLALDVCVLNTVMDAISIGYTVYVLADASRAVNVNPGDQKRAVAEMQNAGARFVTLDQLL